MDDEQRQRERDTDILERERDGALPDEPEAAEQE
jgi:hypothetical protein